MCSVREVLLAPPMVLPPRDPNLGLGVLDHYKEPAEEPILRKLDLDCADKVDQQWFNKDDKIFSQSKMNKISPRRFHPDGVSTSGSNTKSVSSTETVTHPPIILPPKDPTIGLDLVKKCAKPKEFKMLFLPEKIDIDKINEYYHNEDLKIMNKNKQKEEAQIKSTQQSYLCSTPPSNKKSRKALFKLSKNSTRKSFKNYRTSILKRKSVVTKNMKTINESLLDSSLVEKKIFKTKLRGTLQFKSSSAVQKNFPKSPNQILKFSESSQKKKDIPKNVNKKVALKPAKKASASAKKISDEKPCVESVTSYLKEIRNLIALDREDFGNLTKNLDAFKEAYEDRIVEIEDLLQKIELTSSKYKNDENSEPLIARDNKNQTLKKSARRAETLKTSSSTRYEC